MFGKKTNLSSVTGGQAQARPETGRVFQVPYGKVSRVVITICADRVKRNLLLYDPRSNDPDAFLRIRLPDGALPEADEDCLPQHQEGVIIQWAKEDADAYLDCQPMQHSHQDCPVDSGDGQVVRVKATHVASQPVPSAAPQAPQPATPPPPKPAPEPVRYEQNAQQPAVEAQAEDAAVPETPELGEEPLEQATGCIGFMAQRDHSYGKDSYRCFTVDLITETGTMETFRGSHLEDVIRASGVKRGQMVTIMKLPRKQGSNKNRFHLTKH